MLHHQLDGTEVLKGRDMYSCGVMFTDYGAGVDVEGNSQSVITVCARKEVQLRYAIH